MPPAIPLSLGNFRYSGVCPPSNPGRMPLPERLFCPRIPYPAVPPCPAPYPLPFLVFLRLAPSWGLRLFSRSRSASSSATHCTTATLAALGGCTRAWILTPTYEEALTPLIATTLFIVLPARGQKHERVRFRGNP
jgi:hypothetical protein